MKTNSVINKTIENWNKVYFDGDLSLKVIQHLEGLELDKRNEKAQVFLERMFRYMKIAGIQAIDFSDQQAKQLKLVSKLVEDVWQGFILPFTLEERHKKIDEFIRKSRWLNSDIPGKFLDVGCGFPPHTTIETAALFPDWKVIGLDPNLPKYLVKDRENNYATFDEDYHIQYFQGAPGQSLEIWNDPEKAKSYFKDLFKTLLLLLPDEYEIKDSIVTNERGVLIRNPALNYETSNLFFYKGSIGGFNINEVNVVRCFNVLFYFDKVFRNKSLGWFCEILKEGGCLICGINGNHSIRCRYTVYRKEGGKMVAKEFAFSIDNIRPLGSVAWAAFHDDDEETNTLVELIGVLRSNKNFTEKYDMRLDQLLRKKEMYIRDKDGYLIALDTNMSPKEKEKRSVEIVEQLSNEGYVEAAVLELQEQGYNAYRNEIGFIAISLE
ncbi:hypothetical protein [Aquimarina longa]|uniref:hypothetical protein n=1 Tax=Aquimarina longa TaxID=1080221 RepID=UPI000781454B|nr:hypothetical protein [Aquimarina longa]